MEYLSNKTYMFDFVYDSEPIGELVFENTRITFRNLNFTDVQGALAFQESIEDQLPPPEDFVRLTRFELIESIHRDIAIGAFDGEALVGVCVLIRPRKSERNLATCLRRIEFNAVDTLTYDIVLIHPEYRRKGIQSWFINHAVEEAASMNLSTILAVASPRNIASLNSFRKNGFREAGPHVTIFGGKERVVLVRKLPFTS